jgi:hypothetical protein
VDADAPFGTAHTAGDDVAGLFRDCCRTAGEGRRADDLQLLKVRQVGDEICGHAAGEIMLFGIVAEVLEREHHQHRPVRRRQRQWRRRNGNGRSEGCALGYGRGRDIEQIAAPLRGAQQPLGLVAERAADVLDALRDTVFGDEDSWPDRLHQFVPVDERPGIDDQIAQQIERFGPQGQLRAVLGEKTAAHEIERETVEAVDYPRFGAHRLPIALYIEPGGLPPPRGSGGVDLGRQVEPCWHLRSERLIRTPDARRPDGGRSCGHNGLRSSPRPVENIPQQDSAQNAFDKLARTFAAQVEALKRYPSGGEQKMTVQHVHVAEGGQAIVGNVNAPTEGVGARKKWEDQPHTQLAYAPGVEMPRQIDLPDARGWGGAYRA